MSIRILYLMAVAVIVGCSSSAKTAGTVPRTGTLLTAADIAAAHADVQTAYDAVARLRPNWLVVHGVTNTDGTALATVYLDGQQYGAPGSLRNIPAYQVEDMRYYDVTQAGARFGIRGGTGGVIEVRTKTK